MTEILSSIGAILGVILVILIIVKIAVKLTTGWCTSQTSLLGKTAIVTGANTGLGYETALDFAKRGGRVILACRSESKANEAKEKIIEETDNPNVVVKVIDMASLDSVRRFAKDINESEERLDLLVNNAGLGGLGNVKTEDGLLTVMQVNYFSPFLLTVLLIDIMKRTKGTRRRIVNVASTAGKHAKLNVNQLNQFPSTPVFISPDLAVYARSKLCNILFTMELAKRLRGSGITTYSLHPGVIITDFFRNMNPVKRYITQVGISLLFKNAVEGIQTILYTSLEKDIEKWSGQHFEECKVCTPYSTATPVGLPEKLWANTVDLMPWKPEERHLIESLKP